MPDGVLKLYEPGSEGPKWWSKWPDYVRGLPTRSILDRCSRTKTCPKIIEHFGAAELWGLKLGPEWVGTDPKADIRLPKNVRRYYLPSTRDGGGSGSFNVEPPGIPSCPSVGFGIGKLPENPVPHVETRNAIEFHFRNWVMQDIEPPPSRWPKLRGRDATLVEPTKGAMGSPTIPGLPPTAPTGLLNTVLDYDFGPEFDYSDGSGVMSVVPPVVKQVIPSLVPRVDADGNELGGVPTVLRDAPPGTYLGWNIVAADFHAGKGCGYAGGMIMCCCHRRAMNGTDPHRSRRPLRCPGVRVVSNTLDGDAGERWRGSLAHSQPGGRRPQAWEAFSRGSAIRRAGRAGFARNVCVALGILGSPEAVPVLARALADPEPLVRGHAAWALGRVGGAAARVGLSGAASSEEDGWVSAELEDATSRAG